MFEFCPENQSSILKNSDLNVFKSTSDDDDFISSNYIRLQHTMPKFFIPIDHHKKDHSAKEQHQKLLISEHYFHFSVFPATIILMPDTYDEPSVNTNSSFHVGIEILVFLLNY